ncbi:MAG: hypothetical protein Q9191_004867 [Dirinaria sp. TL-2023a]
MSEKRRPSTRYRGEPPAKKRATTPTPPTQPRPAPTPTPQAEDDSLPTKLSDGQKLPTLSEPQDSDLLDSEYQNIAESGVLATSIEQSRRKWAVDGIFERYWAKPSKKRNHEVPNPAKESMARLGICSMVIEPHIFEITLYTVRDPQPTSQPPLPQQPPLSTAPSQLPPKSPATNGQPQGQSPSTLSHTSLPPFREGFAAFDSQGQPPPIYHPFAPPTPSPAGHSPHVPQGPNPSGQSETQVPHSKNSPDPVIQMLATRAASDHELKSLMKVVASGRASHIELREFQTHIDELNAQIKGGRGPSSPPRDPNLPKPSPGGNSLTASSTGSTLQTSDAATSRNSSPYPPPTRYTKNEAPYYSQYHPPVKPKASHSYKSDVSAVVFDFGGTGDRFLFPRFSILEYLPGRTQVIVSFLVIRRGNDAYSGKYKEHMSYYQRVTVRLTAQQPRTLEPLTKIVAPPEDVRHFMNDVFDKMNPAEPAHLAIRLPRIKDVGAIEIDKASLSVEKPIIKPFYKPPDTIVPMVA